MIGEHLATFVRNRMREQKLTARELAGRVGVSEKHLSNMLTGHGNGSVVMWDQVLRAVGTDSPNWLDDLLVMHYIEAISEKPAADRELLVEGFRTGYRTGLALVTW